MEAANKKIELAEEMEAEAQKKNAEAEKVREEASQKVKILSHIARMAFCHHTASEIKFSLIQEFGLTEEEAEEEYRRVVE